MNEGKGLAISSSGITKMAPANKDVRGIVAPTEGWDGMTSPRDERPGL